MSLIAGIVAAAALSASRSAGRARAGSAVEPGTPIVLLVTAAGIALTGLLLEALFRSARLQSLQAYDAWAFWVPKAKAIFFFDGLDAQVFTTAAGPDVPAARADPRRGRLPRDGRRRTSSPCTCSSGSSSSVRSPRSPGCLHRHVPAWLLWPSLLLVLVVPRFGERLLAPQADVLVDVLFVVGALLARALAARPATAGGSRPRQCCSPGATLTKREGLLFSRPACSRPRSSLVAAAGAALAAPRLVAVVVVAAASRGGSGSGRTTSPARRRRRLGAGALDGRSTRCGSRSTFSSNERSGRWCRSSRLIAVAAALVWGDRRVAGLLGARRACVPRAASG